MEFWLFGKAWIVSESNCKIAQGTELAHGQVNKVAGAIIDDDSQFVRVCKRFNEELGEWFFSQRNCLNIILLEAVPDGKFYAYV